MSAITTGSIFDVRGYGYLLVLYPSVDRLPDERTGQWACLFLDFNNVVGFRSESWLSNYGWRIA